MLRKIILAGLVFLAIPFTSYSGGYVELPRSFGGLEMGMSEAAFIELTGMTPESCAICIKKETFATLSSEQLADIDADGNGADLFFYNKKLYLVSMGTQSKDLMAIKEDFEHSFGGPGVKLGTFNDVAKLKWEDQDSIVTLNYHAKNKNVFSVNYYDWDLKQERDWRESLAQEEAAKKPKTVATVP